MPNARHIGRAGLDDDKKLDFVSPDARADRSASHRYFPQESRAARGKSAIAARAEEPFSAIDFKPRWWPAPDSAQ
jgi:hypothetical protein